MCVCLVTSRNPGVAPYTVSRHYPQNSAFLHYVICNTITNTKNVIQKYYTKSWSYNSSISIKIIGCIARKQVDIMTDVFTAVFKTGGVRGAVMSALVTHTCTPA